MRNQANTEGDSVYMGMLFVAVLGISLSFVIGFSIKTIVLG